MSSNLKSPHHYSIYNFLWDTWCTISVIGIWPRFIEPKILCTSRLNLKITGLHPDLKKIKLLQISDLHLGAHVSDRFLAKIKDKIQMLKPDLIFFTGDFLCYGQFSEAERMTSFLNQLTCPYGSYAIPGNHDYNKFVSVNDQGDYDIIDNKTSTLTRGFSRLFSQLTLSKQRTSRVNHLSVNPQLLELIHNTPIRFLNNTHVLIPIKKTFLNICGLGEYIAGQCLPEKAFSNYNPEYPGIILAHNPDSISLLKNWPGDIILSGHTHGGQVNLPFLWKKFMLSEYMSLKKGLYRIYNKYLYVNRGVGSVMQFRWFSPPELTLITLE